jgi:hypothetical protein
MLADDSVFFLLGAGASYDAGIPVSSQMVQEVEKLILADKKWMSYKDLYYCIKSAIINAAGIIGNFSSDIVNIETIVNTMDELIKSNHHPLYPFVGSWIPRLNEVTDNKFQKITELRDLIVSELNSDWTRYKQRDNIEYYKKFDDFQREYNFKLNIFSLNYDLCLEGAIGKEKIQRGFTKNHIWDWKTFDAGTDDVTPIWLYKLHGSIDWQKNDNDEVEETTGNIPLNKSAIIFGTSYKLQYIDPFLYLVNEFRKKTLDKKTKIIICIGYSFNDEHINSILGQGMHANKFKIVSVAPLERDDVGTEKKIKNKLKIENAEDIIFIKKHANDFISSLSTELIESYLPKENIPY